MRESCNDVDNGSGSDEVDEDCDDNDDDEEDYEEMTEEQYMIWSFFQEASVADIGIIPGCSEKKATEIIKLRPFRHFHDLVSIYICFDNLAFLRNCLRFLSIELYFPPVFGAAFHLHNCVELV